MPRVHLPDGRVVNFPEGMPPEQIAAEVAKLSPAEPAAAGQPQQSPFVTAREASMQPPSRAEAMMLVPGGQIPGAGRLLSAAWGGVKGAASRMPIVGPMGKGFIQGAKNAWKGSAPPPAAAPPMAAPMAHTAPTGPMPKPKLSAKEFTKAHQQQYGAEQSARLRTPFRHVETRKAQADAIRNTTGIRGQLPQNAQQAIRKGLEETTDPNAAWQFVTKAPNSRAREFLLSLMRGK